MKKIAVVYWSGTGNTEAMANAVAEGIEQAGSSADLLESSAFGPEKVDAYDAIAFGCPAMGGEVLEESEFEPMFMAVESSLSGKPVALFGSYGWGDGQWMRDWTERAQADGANVLNGEGLMVNGTPGDAELVECRQLGEDLAAE